MFTAIFSNVKLIGAVAIGALLMGGGYAFGARKVEALEAQIAKIKNESDDAAARLKKSQDEIAFALQERDRVYAKQTEQLKAESERKAKDLSAALTGANQRVASLQAQVSVVDARRAKLVADQEKASASERQALQAQIDALDKEKRTLIASVDANQCLKLAVPEPVIGSLVGK
jgi:septal ring factor EnvC (AmiA/AmiB activator)